MSYSMNGLGKTYHTSVDMDHSHTVTIPNGYGVVGFGAASDRAAARRGGGSGGVDEESAKAKARGWWDERSKMEKGAIVVGSLSTFGLLVLALTGAPKRRMRTRA
jgi:hypothetical protein